MPLTVVRPSPPDDEQVSGVRSLIAALTRDGGRDPLSDRALSHLTSAAAEHALAIDDDGSIRGYAQLDGDSLEIAAEAAAVGALLDSFVGRRLLVWSHGRDSALPAALRDRGFVDERELYQLRRPMREPLTVPRTPDGVRIRAFRAGADEDDWLQVNSAAFADHPEQGRWTRSDIEAREREPWFDPDGFFLAWRGDELLGFHWTKVHPDGAGEVYVIGVAPAAQGLGLGAVLLLHGLESLRERGCSEVLLYVDGSNAGAMRLYLRYGFRQHDLDVQWSNQSASTGSVSNT